MQKAALRLTILTSLSTERRQARLDNDEPFCFRHTLTDQVGGQIDAGLAITGWFEDRWSDWSISEYITHVHRNEGHKT